MDTKPVSVSQLFPSRWLTAADLGGQSYTLTVHRVEVVQVHSPFTNQNEWRAAVEFEGARKQLLLNVSQARALADLAGGEVFDNWTGLKVRLSPGRARNGKDTIVISR